MIYTVTYIEEIRPTWREFDRKIHENLQGAFGIDVHYYVGRRGYDKRWFDTTMGHEARKFVYSVHDVGRELENINYVNVQPPKVFEEHNVGEKYELDDFIHPDEDCCYIFGPNHGEVVIAPQGLNVTIPVNKSSLYASSAVAIVMYDRRMKNDSCRWST